jgi:hypothetical protein
MVNTARGTGMPGRKYEKKKKNVMNFKILFQHYPGGKEENKEPVQS